MRGARARSSAARELSLMPRELPSSAVRAAPGRRLQRRWASGKGPQDGPVWRPPKTLSKRRLQLLHLQRQIERIVARQKQMFVDQSQAVSSFWGPPISELRTDFTYTRSGFLSERWVRLRNSQAK